MRVDTFVPQIASRLNRRLRGFRLGLGADRLDDELLQLDRWRDFDVA
jgi:hypothetical protein